MRGDVRQSWVAILFASFLNFSIVVTFLWVQWLEGWLVIAMWVGLILVAGFAAVYNFSRLSRWLDQAADGERIRQRLQLAQEQYLRGDYFEAEALVHRILSAQQSDCEAALLLISVHRRTQRWKSALRMLDRLRLIDGWQRWEFEMAREERLIESAMREQAGE